MIFTVTTLSLLLGFSLWSQGRRAQAKASLAAPAAMAGAITLTIDPGADNAGAVAELISAINTANGDAAADTINLFPCGTYTVTATNNFWYGPNALPEIKSAITIEGQGATLQIAAGTTRLRFFYVGANPAASGTLGYHTPGAGNLTLRNLTLRGGRQKGGDSNFGGGGAGMGGAVFNQGALTLEAVTFTNNRVTDGGHRDGSGDTGGGMGQDAQGNNGGGFGGAVTPAGSLGGAGVAGVGNVGGGGGGFPPAPSGNGGSGDTGGNGGGTRDGLGGGSNSGQGSGGGLVVSGSSSSSGNGGGFGFGGFGGAAGGGGGVGGGGAGAAGGGGGFGGGGGAGATGGCGGFGGGGGFGRCGGFGGGGSGGGAGMGGAIFNHGGMLTITNSTFTANSATGGGAAFVGGSNGSGLGGAIFNLNGSVTLRFSTLAANSVAAGTGGVVGGRADGGAVYNLGYHLVAGQTATLTVDNSILATTGGGTNDLVNDRPANVAAAAGGGVNNATASATFTNNNLVMNYADQGGATSSGPAPLTDNPNLGALTFPVCKPGVLPITITSPAFDATDCDLAVTTDQRGVLRPQGAACDLGAYELIPNTPPTISGATISRQQGAAGTVSTIAHVNDAEDTPGSLTLTVTSVPAGITITGLTNTNGAITANVAAACNATLGAKTVGLRVTDSGGLMATANLTVNVTASNAPAITLNPSITLWPPNHTYQTITMAQMLQSATGDCGGDLSGAVVIEKVTSDEPDNVKGGSDGETINDIVIAADCKSVQLRAERDDKKNGRVYVVTLRVKDTVGVTTRKDFKVSVPLNQSGAAAVQGAAAQTKTSSCP
jgi:hypothetical protein